MHILLNLDDFPSCMYQDFGQTHVRDASQALDASMTLFIGALYWHQLYRPYQTYFDIWFPVDSWVPALYSAVRALFCRIPLLGYPGIWTRACSCSVRVSLSQLNAMHAQLSLSFLHYQVVINWQAGTSIPLIGDDSQLDMACRKAFPAIMVHLILMLREFQGRLWPNRFVLILLSISPNHSRAIRHQSVEPLVSEKSPVLRTLAAYQCPQFPLLHLASALSSISSRRCDEDLGAWRYPVNLA
jgi:hypothetical protein